MCPGDRHQGVVAYIAAYEYATVDEILQSAADKNEDPFIILLDDVMSELDNSRQDYLLNHLNNRQVFITCCSPETVNLLKKGKTFFVDGGIITND